MSESINITPQDLEETPEEVGHLKGVKLYKAKLIGGASIMCKHDGKSLEVLAWAPHPAICKFMAEQKNPGIVWTELSKHEELDPSYFKHLIPLYEAETERWNKLK